MSLIAARAALTGGKKAPTAKDYVQDGLIAMWDGIENAGWGVHDDAATVWADLVGGIGDMHTYDSQAPEWEDNCWTKSNETASHDGFKGFYADSFLPSPLTGTIVVNPCFSATTVNWSGSSLFANRTSWTTGVFQYSVNSNSTKIECLGNGLTVVDKGTVVLPFTGTSCCEISGTDYLNSRFYIGNFQNGSYPLDNIKLYCLRVYSRALTADEIAANYATDKQRFNLP